MFNITLYGLNSAIDTEANGNCLLSEVIPASFVSLDIDAYYLLFRPEKNSDVRTGAGGVKKDDNIYSDTFDIDTKQYQLSDFGTFQTSLLSVLRAEAKYIQVNTYDFNCFATTECMPFEVMELTPENSNSWNSFKLKLVKANAKY